MRGGVDGREEKGEKKRREEEFKVTYKTRKRKGTHWVIYAKVEIGEGVDLLMKNTVNAL